MSARGRQVNQRKVHVPDPRSRNEIRVNHYILFVASGAGKRRGQRRTSTLRKKKKKRGMWGYSLRVPHLAILMRVEPTQELCRRLRPDKQPRLKECWSGKATKELF